jgi:hypothetical protein
VAVASSVPQLVAEPDGQRGRQVGRPGGDQEQPVGERRVEMVDGAAPRRAAWERSVRKEQGGTTAPGDSAGKHCGQHGSGGGVAYRQQKQGVMENKQHQQ